MSQYTFPYVYGQYSGAPPPPPPPQQPQSYGYQATPPYPPAYNQPYDQRGSEIHRTASQNSFNYNANQIPGLGIGPPPIPAAFGTVADANAWPQQPPFPGNVAPPPHPSPAGLFKPFGPPHPTASWGTSTAPSAPRGTQQAPTIPPVSQTQTQPVSSNDIEEGELSEGQFEDLYEPRETSQPIAPSQSQAKQPATIEQPASPVDTPEAGFYGNDEDDGAIPVAKDNIHAADGREGSGSYSPFLSPREIRTENTTPQDVCGDRDDPSSPFLAPSQSAMLKAALDSQPASLQKNGEGKVQAVPGLQYAHQQHAHGKPSATHQPQGNTMESQPSPATYDRFSSLQEAKKEAQKAILRLWPLGVKFQHYIEEGFDQNVIKGLFGDLHLDMPKTEGDVPKAAGQGSVSVQVKTSTLTPPKLSDTQLSTDSINEPASKADKSAKGEERKDRIARLLAAKAAKAPAVPNTKLTPSQRDTVAQGQTEHQSHAPGASTPPKNKTWGEKERLLQQKIAALQKSREAQALKQAVEEPSRGTAALNSGGGTPAKNNQPGGAQSSMIPALLPPSTTLPNQPATHRKRPVAADFVEYSSTVGPTKRPFGQDRTQSSLIIDISDGSDDEEMDMDVDSPIDEPQASKGGFGQRGPLIRDFPPLTDTRPPRQFTSPVPISQTPPNSSLNLKRREAELNLKEKAIQEMKRKIAEAEARKAKKSSGSQTPQASQTPEMKENEGARAPASTRISADGSAAALTSDASSAKLPKTRGRQLSNQLDNAGRRGRIVSVELPRIDGSLEDKMRRLNQLRDEEQRLKAEIDDELARKKMLTEELEQINIEPSEATSELSGENSARSTAPQSQAGNATAEGTPSASEIPPNAPDQGLALPSDGDSDISMDEEHSSRESSPASVSHEDNHLQHGTEEMTNADAEMENATSSNEPQSSHSSEAEEGRLEPSSGPEKDDGTGIHSSSSDAPGCSADPADGEEAAKVDDTQMDGEAAECSISIESKVGPLSSLGPNATVGYLSADENTSEAPIDEQFDQISGVGQPRQNVQEIEDAQQIEAVVPEVIHEAPETSEHAFQPYTSPLRYFHAYRYHSDYPSSVAGGLRSLTYSNRIDPTKPLCPRELAGQQCPPGCDFQHYGSISVPDDQILVELGRSDDYIGDQKNRFIQGLRDLLQEFKAKKVKDFDAIARGIIEYRANFLGDPSKVLHLEGVIL